MCLVGATESHYGATTFMFVVENDRMCRESAVSVGDGGRVSAKAMQRPVPAAVIQRRTRQSLVSTMPAQCFIRPSIQRSPRYAVHSAQVHSALTWFSPPVETVALGVAAEQSPATWSHSYPKSRSALVARGLAHFKVNVIALCETCFSEHGELKEFDARYTSGLSGCPSAEGGKARIAFVTANDVVRRLPRQPQGFIYRLVTMRLLLRGNMFASASALTSLPLVTSSSGMKNKIYEDLLALLEMASLVTPIPSSAKPTLPGFAGIIFVYVYRSCLNARQEREIFPKIQCGFRKYRRTADMVFVVCKQQELPRNEYQPPHNLRVLTKSFDIMNQDGLVCIFAPTLFSLISSILLMDAYRGELSGIDNDYRTDGKLFNTRHLEAYSRIVQASVHDLLFADDCAPDTTMEKDMQRNVDLFVPGCPNLCPPNQHGEVSGPAATGVIC
nr:unnamed protein product [Spirometra erinaceieuropaei]